MTQEENLKEFLKILPFEFKDKKLLKQVFVHKSFLNEKGGEGLECNERLEFLGDSVLQTITSDILFKKNPYADEGVLTQARSRLVNRKIFADFALELNLGSMMYLSKGEEKNNGNENPQILGDTFEAFIGAMYLERGLADTFEFVETLVNPLLESSVTEKEYFDYKPALQELSQKIFKNPPEYRLIKEEGEAHRRTYHIEVVIDGRVRGVGRGTKKKDAEQQAAQIAIVLLNKEQP